MNIVQIVIRLEYFHNGKVFPRDELVYAPDDATVRYLFRAIREVKSIALYDRESNSVKAIEKESKLENNATYLVNSWDWQGTKKYLDFIIKHKGRRLWRDRG